MHVIVSRSLLEFARQLRQRDELQNVRLIPLSLLQGPRLAVSKAKTGDMCRVNMAIVGLPPVAEDVPSVCVVDRT